MEAYLKALESYPFPVEKQGKARNLLTGDDLRVQIRLEGERLIIEYST